MVSQGIKLNHKFCINNDAKKLYASLHKQLKEKHKRPHMRLEDFQNLFKQVIKGLNQTDYESHAGNTASPESSNDHKLNRMQSEHFHLKSVSNLNEVTMNTGYDSILDPQASITGNSINKSENKSMKKQQAATKYGRQGAKTPE